MICRNCGAYNVEDQGYSNPADPNVDVPKPIDPDTGTFKRWLTYALDALALDRLFIKELRFALNRANPPKVKQYRDELVAWGNKYIKLRCPSDPLECGDEVNAESLEIRPINLHTTWDATAPSWFDDDWLKEGFWTYYDEAYPKLKEW